MCHLWMFPPRGDVPFRDHVPFRDDVPFQDGDFVAFPRRKVPPMRSHASNELLPMKTSSSAIGLDPSSILILIG